MFSTFPNIGLFGGFSDNRVFKDNDLFKSNYFYEETTKLIDLFYIYEEIDFENKKVKKLVGFVDEFNIAKKLVKALNKQYNSNRYDFDKVELMDKSEINRFFLNQYKEAV